MPPIRVLTYQEGDGDVPLHAWLRAIGTQNRDAAARCRDLIQRLAESGHALRRPSSAPLRDEIHELRARVGKVNYRVLYFFNGRGECVLASGCTKEGAIDPADIDRAVRYKVKFRADPVRHTYNRPEAAASSPHRTTQHRDNKR